MSINPVDVERADVYKGSLLAGSLRRETDDVVFEYLADYTGAPVATTLPRPPSSHLSRGGAVPAFFAGLLPEGRRLSALQARLKTSRDDEFSQLVAIGADCIGDVRVIAPDTAPNLEPTIEAAEPHNISLRTLLESEIGSLGRGPNVPGVQDKISNRMVSVPVVGAFGPAIIKISPPEVPRVVENEAFFLDVARACGLEVPHFRVITDRDDVTGLVISRFDRTRLRDGTTLSLAQEDAVQLAGRWPASKYRMTTREVFAAVANVVDAPVVELTKLLRLFAMSYIIGNGDLHAKNVSVYLKDDLWRVTPAYDIVSTLPYGDRTMALSLEGRDDHIRARDFITIAARHDIGEKVTRRILKEVVEACLDLIPHVDSVGLEERRSDDLKNTARKRAAELVDD